MRRGLSGIHVAATVGKVCAVALGAAFRSLGGAQKVGVIFSGGNVSLDKLYW